jgi:hypothetical protein
MPRFFRDSEKARQRTCSRMTGWSLKLYEEHQMTLPTVEDAWKELEYQGWRCGPALLLVEKLYVHHRFRPYGYGIIPDDHRVITWEASVNTEITYLADANSSHVTEIKVQSYSALFNIFKIELDPQYIFEVTQNLLEETVKRGSYPRSFKTQSLTLNFPFQILPKLATGKLTWILDDGGQIWRRSVDQGGSLRRKMVIFFGSGVRTVMPS